VFKLERKLDPDDLIQTFFEVNKKDHQRPPPPLGDPVSRGPVHQATAPRLGQGALLFRQGRAHQEYSILYNCPYPEVRRIGFPRRSKKRAKT
jgi:hypothetical protein